MAIDFRESYPYWYYSRVTLAEAGVSLGAQYIVKDIKYGFDYWVRALLISYPHYTHIANPDDVSPPIYISLVQSERNRNITEVSIPVELMSTPGGKQPTPPGHPQHDKQLRNGFIRFNYLLSNSDVLKMRISGHAGGFPEYVRIVVVGNNVKIGQHA